MWYNNLMISNNDIIKQIRHLRSKGKTYTEIRKSLKINIPKSTLSYRCKDVKLLPSQKERIAEMSQNNLNKGRLIALENSKIKRERFFKKLFENNHHLKKLLDKQDISKLALAILYLTEGSRTRKGYLMFGNSNPAIIALFLKLLRRLKGINEGKFRCTVQCRADQNVKDLKYFWSKITDIPPKQFYKARIDPRTVGKKSKRQDYKGVCRIDYFSADVYNELKVIGDIIIK